MEEDGIDLEGLSLPRFGDARSIISELKYEGKCGADLSKIESFTWRKSRWAAVFSPFVELETCFRANPSPEEGVAKPKAFEGPELPGSYRQWQA